MSLRPSARPFLAVTVVAIAFLSGCPVETPQTKAAPGVSGALTEEPPPGDDAYLCKTDDDCTITCAQGAVNRRWYEANETKLAHCKDGCVGWGATRAQCIDATCVAMHRGARDERCTRKSIQWRGKE